MSSAGPAAAETNPATLSLDLDNLWCYQRSFGDATWKDYPSFLELALPRIFEILSKLDLRLTLFIIGRDAERQTVAPLLLEAIRQGHEAGNHSFDHDTSMHGWPLERVREDILRADQAIHAATGQRPRGFRGPAYAISPQLLESLGGLGYDYDASSYESSLSVLTRSYHRKQVARLGNKGAMVVEGSGGARSLWRSLHPHTWSLAARTIVEVPVTTLPFLRFPIHGTYLNYLAGFSEDLAMQYFRMALWLCQRRKVAPSFLLHATDFLGADDRLGLDYLPGMGRPAAAKIGFMTAVLRHYCQAFQVRPIGNYVDELRASRALDSIPVAAVS